MLAGGTMLARLDVETVEHHRAAEGRWRRLLARPPTREDYAHVLAKTYGFEAPVETACSYTQGIGQAINLQGRWRSWLIAQDLLAVGWSSPDVTSMRCASIAPFQDAAEALAWLYVIELPMSMYAQVREALIGRFVDLQVATSYLTLFATAVSRRRAELGIALDRVARSDRASQRVVETVRAAFVAMREWFEPEQLELRIVG
jgi:heme oxygenase